MKKLKTRNLTSKSLFCVNLLGLFYNVCIKGLKGPVFEIMTRIGTIHIYRIIKQINFIQKRDFHEYLEIFITKKAHILYIWPKLAELNSPQFL